MLAVVLDERGEIFLVSLEEELERVLNNLLEGLHEFTADSYDDVSTGTRKKHFVKKRVLTSIDDSVIKRSGDGNLLVKLSRTVLTLDCSLDDRSNSKDAGLRGVDDGGEPLDGGVH